MPFSWAALWTLLAAAVCVGGSEEAARPRVRFDALAELVTQKSCARGRCASLPFDLFNATYIDVHDCDKCLVSGRQKKPSEL